MTARRCPQNPVGQHATNKRRHIDKRRVGSVDRVGLLIAILEEPLQHIKNQKRSHAVVGESFPHFGKEQRE